MPIYEYKCKKCGYVFELIQKFSDPPVAKCPKCGGKAERILSSRVAFNFKGAGFYTTDYNSKSNNTPTVKEKSKDKTKKGKDKH